MNKTELIEAIVAETGLNKGDAGKALDAFTNIVKNALQKGEDVTLVGFGSFTVAERKERQGFNLHTQQPITIPAAKVPKFKPGKMLKDALASEEATKK